jgi:hypothetical protein
VESLDVFPVFPRGREKFLDGSVQFVDWWSEAPQAESTVVSLELSTTGPGGPWQPIADSLPNAGRYQWSIPQGIVSGDCRIRYSVAGPAGAATAITPRSFAIGDTSVGVEGKVPHARRPRVDVVPTPARDRVTVTATALRAGPARLRLFDAAGREAARWDRQVREARSRFELDLPGLPPGAYFLRIETAGGTLSSRLPVLR